MEREKLYFKIDILFVEINSHVLPNMYFMFIFLYSINSVMGITLSDYHRGTNQGYVETEYGVVGGVFGEWI